MEIYRACKDRAYIHKRKEKIQSMYPQIFSVPKREQIDHQQEQIKHAQI